MQVLYTRIYKYSPLCMYILTMFVFYVYIVNITPAKQIFIYLFFLPLPWQSPNPKKHECETHGLTKTDLKKGHHNKVKSGRA